MLMTLEKQNGMRLVLDVSRVGYLGPAIDMEVRFIDFVADATIRMATDEESLYFAPPTEESQ